MAPEPAGRIERLHPASLLFSLGATVRGLLVPGLLFLFFSRGSAASLWVMTLIPISAAFALVRYLSFGYRLDRDEIVIRQGILTRNERHVPYSRIQNIDLVQSPLQRLLEVGVVRLETASGSEPEAVMRVVSLDALRVLRQAVFRERGEAPEGSPETGGETAAAPPRQELLRLPLRELTLLGLLSNRGLALVAAALGVLWQSDVFDFEQAFEGFPARARALAGDVVLPGPLATAILVALALLALTVVLRLLSIAWSVIKFHGFRLTLVGQDLRSEYGLFTRVSATIPRKRIQRVTVTTRPLHRWCGRALVQAETAGGHEEAAEAGAERQWLAPLIPRAAVPAFVRAVLPAIDLEAVAWEGLAPHARRRIARRSLIVSAVIAAAALALVRPWGALVLVPGVALSLLHASRYVRHTAWAVTDGGMLYRSGWWIRRVSIVPFEKMQVVALGQSPWDRRHGMAGIAVDTAGAGPIDHAIDVRYLDGSTARALAGRLTREAADRPFRW